MKKFLTMVLLMASALGGFGQEGRLDLKQLVHSALERNPRIKSFQRQAEAQKFRIAPEGALPDPVIGLSLKNMGLDRLTVGDEVMSGVGVSMSQMIPFPGKLRLKSEMASKRALQSEQGLRLARLSLIREVKDLYAKIFYYEKALALLERKRGILENALKLAEVKYSLGKGSQSDIFKAQVEISGIQEMKLSMDQMLQASRANINSLLDLPAENPLGHPQEIPFYELKLSLEELREASLKNSPAIKEAELMVEENQVGVKMARKEFYPNFMLQAGKDFKGRLMDMYEVMVGVEIPLYYKKKQAKLLEESLAKLESSKNDSSSMKNEVGFMLNENFLMARTAGNLVRLYRERIIPQASLALESSLANYQVDKVDFLMLLSDISSLVSFEMESVKNLAALWSSTAKIEELISLEILK